MKTIDCLSYSVCSGDINLENIIDKKIIINTINPHCYCEAKKDSFYQQALHHSDILLPDGIGIVWAIRFLSGQKVKRISGSDIHNGLIQKINEIGGKVFYMGSAPETLQKIQKRVNLEYPNIIVGVYSPPYKTIFSNQENVQIISAINAFQPDVLFVGMTAPKQEKWVHQHKDLINTKVIASIGAVFDFYAKTIKRPGRLWISLGLEWFPRLLQEPKRLWRRNLISTPRFMLEVFLAKINWLNHKHRY